LRGNRKKGFRRIQGKGEKMSGPVVLRAWREEGSDRQIDIKKNKSLGKKSRNLRNKVKGGACPKKAGQLRVCQRPRNRKGQYEVTLGNIVAIGDRETGSSDNHEEGVRIASRAKGKEKSSDATF